MRKLSAFTFVSLDGYYKGLNEDISWNKHGQEEAEFSAKNLEANHILLFGRVTYNMMADFWTTQAAWESLPIVAKGMNEAEKIVFSNTMDKADWVNTKVINNNIVNKTRELKNQPGKDMTILGSGSILNQFAEAGLIDEYQIMIYPIAIGTGISLFGGIKNTLSLKLIGTRTFESGTVVLSYQPN
ncbi:MAG: dihydrofolate reductase family protein [Mucilaginibacter sp.]